MLVLAFLGVVLFQALSIFFYSAVLSSMIATLSLEQSFAYLGTAWILFLLCSDAVLYVFYSVKLAKFPVGYARVFQNFSFHNQDLKFKVFFSNQSPIFMRLGLLNKGKLLINEELFTEFNPSELKAFLSLELTYNQTFASFVETLLNRSYVVFWYPWRKLLESLFGDILASYMLGAFDLFYCLTIRICRSSFSYAGKFASALPQIVFKVKILGRRHGKIKLFCYSEQCLNSMLPEEYRVSDYELSKFEMDDIFR